jgi:hypothetical protein
MRKASTNGAGLVFGLEVPKRLNCGTKLRFRLVLIRLPALQRAASDAQQFGNGALPQLEVYATLLEVIPNGLRS